MKIKKFINFNEKWEVFYKKNFGEYFIEFVTDFSNSRNTLFGISLKITFIDGFESELTIIFNHYKNDTSSSYYNFISSKIKNPKKLYSDMKSVLESQKIKLDQYDNRFLTSFENDFTYENFIKNMKESKAEIKDKQQTINYLNKRLKDNFKEQSRLLDQVLDNDNIMSKEEKEKLKMLRQEEENLTLELDKLTRN